MSRIYLPFLVIFFLNVSQTLTAEISKPNIIFILADDMGWADAGCYGHPYAKTPSIDKLAQEGTRFLQCYATGVTCCPSRTGFMTGKFPATFANYPSGSGFGERITITELLKKQGYVTGHFGKWHIGPETKNGTYGIDEIGSDSEDVPKRKITDHSRGRDAKIYDQAISFIEQHKNVPFYINIWDHIPHHPVNPAPGVIDAFGSLKVDESKFHDELTKKFALCRKLGGDPVEHLRAFLAEVKSMDDEIGRLLYSLEQLGLVENTIVVFSSDQGSAPLRDPETSKQEKLSAATDPAKNLRLNAMGNVGIYRGSKHTQYEGGVRIPFIVRWPGHVPAGRVDEKSVLSGADWLPTLSAITGIKINEKDFDGEDVSKAWLGKTHTRAKPLYWKTSSTNSSPALRVDNWKFHGSVRKKVEVELYDLSTDPAEKQNLAAKHPELVDKFSKQLQTWVNTLPKEYLHVEKGDD